MKLTPLSLPRVYGQNRDPSDDFWFGPVGKQSASGISVTVDNALTVPVVYDCLQVLSQSIGTLPWGIFERNPRDQSKQRRDEHPLVQVFSRPNPETTDVEFFGQMVFDLASDGNAFIELQPGPIGPVSQLWRHEPSKCRVERVSDGSKRYVVTLDNGTTSIYTPNNMWHLKILPHAEGGLRGMSPIHIGREAIGAAIAVQRFAGRFFDNDATPPFVIEHPTHFDNEDSKSNFLSAIRRWWGGARRHSPGVLEYGMKLNRVGVNNEEAQFLETKNSLSNDIARIWRMPPHKVGVLDKATFSNIEQQSLEFVVDTLLPWLRLIERSIRRNLIIASNRFFFEFNVAGLLRGDLAARYSAYATARQWGWLSVNDIRRLENMNPIDDGDVYLTPMNMQPAGQETNQANGSANGGSQPPNSSRRIEEQASLN